MCASWYLYRRGCDARHDNLSHCNTEFFGVATRKFSEMLMLTFCVSVGPPRPGVVVKRPAGTDHAERHDTRQAASQLGTFSAWLGTSGSGDGEPIQALV